MIGEYITDVGDHVVHIDTIRDEVTAKMEEVLNETYSQYEYEFDVDWWHDALDRALDGPTPEV